MTAPEPELRSSRLARFGTPLACGLAHSAAMLLAAPPLCWWPFALLSILPLVWGASRPGARTWRDGVLMALGSLLHWVVIQWWVHEVTAAGFIPFVFVLASLTGIATASLVGAGRVLPRLPWALLAPICWTGAEYFRGEVFGDGYAWGYPVHPLIDAPGVPGLASLGGAYFVSALLAAFSGGLVDFIRARRAAQDPRRLGGRLAGVLGIAALPLACLAGLFVTPPARTGDEVRVAAIQTNLPQSNKVAWSIDDEVRDLARFEDLTSDAAKQHPDLICWPETMTPGVTLVDESLRTLDRERLAFTLKSGRQIAASALTREVLQFQGSLGIPMLVGEEAIDGLKISDVDGHVQFSQRARYNSAFLLEGGKVAPGRYDKIRLTPFGETMPGIRNFPELQQQLLDIGARGMKFDLAMGKTPFVFEVPRAGGDKPLRVVTPICFEMSVAPVCRELVYDHAQRRADVIITLTNDGWFGQSDLARLQHLQISRWRAAELGTPVVRVVNTGISAFIDARGRLIRSGTDDHPGASRVDGVLQGSVALVTGATLYATLGDAAGIGLYYLWVGLVLLGAWARFRAWRLRRTRARPAK